MSVRDGELATFFLELFLFFLGMGVSSNHPTANVGVIEGEQRIYQQRHTLDGMNLPHVYQLERTFFL